jgi:hypothetical protein
MRRQTPMAGLILSATGRQFLEQALHFIIEGLRLDALLAHRCLLPSAFGFFRLNLSGGIGAGTL